MTLYLLTDFGLDDEFVGILHAVLARKAPGVERIDLTHGIPAHDVAAGAMTLWRCSPWVRGGVVLAVVDPGVASDRRAVALEVRDPGDATVTHLVGPDNGLLLPAANALGDIAGAVELPVVEAHTFAGRDTFAPAAAALAAGRPLSQLGADLDPAGLIGQPVPEPAISADRLVGEVLWVDTYGNAQLNLSPHHLPRTGGPVTVETAGQRLTLRVVRSYAAIGPDPYALVVDSYGRLAVCSDRSPAAARLGLTPGTKVVLRPERVGDDPR